jgi:hypothetical protein
MSKERTNAKRAVRVAPLPLTTLGDLLAYGLEVHIWCPRCHTWGRPTIPAEKLRSRFAGARFRCSRCAAPGHPSFRAGPHTPKRQGDRITDLYCPHCVPPWEMSDVRLDEPPWAAFTLDSDERFACPGCDCIDRRSAHHIIARFFGQGSAEAVVGTLDRHRWLSK